MGSAKVIDKGPGDKTVILNVRSKCRQAFDAPGWIDLRAGFLLSLTQAGADDTITGLAETISGPSVNPADAYWIGVKTSDSLMPLTTGTVFIGFSNVRQTNEHPSSALVSSDLAIGTTNTNFWRPTSTEDPTNRTGGIYDGLSERSAWGDGVQPHFAQNTGGAGGYATLLMFRFTRPNATSNLVTVTTKVGTHSGDVLFTNTPTELLLQANLEGFPASVRQVGPVNVSTVPDALYLYWPFHNSRLRIHAMGVLQISP